MPSCKLLLKAFVLLSAIVVGGIANSQTKIMPLGDSITRGTFNFSFNGTDYPDSAYRLSDGGIPNTLRSYREHLHDSLEACNANFEWVGTRTSGTTNRTPSIHEGRSGWRVDDYLNQTWADETGLYNGSDDLEGWLGTIQPDVITIHLATNDIGQGQSATSTITDLETLLDNIYGQLPSVTVVLANVVPIVGWHGDHFYTSAVPALVQEEAAAVTAAIPNIVSAQQALNRDIYMVDVNSGYTNNESNVVSCPSTGIGNGGDPTNMSLANCIVEPGTSTSPPTLIPDGIHPNLLGDKHIADQFFTVLDNDLNLCGVPVDTTKPVTVINATANDGDIINMPFTLAGTATDTGGSGLSRTRVAIQDNQNGGGWYKFDGTFNSGSPLVSVDATQLNTTVSFTDWEQDLVGLPAGDYTLFVLTEDNAGNNFFAPRTWTERNLIVEGNSPDVTKPVTVIDATANDGDEITMPFTLAGTATDTGGSGLNRTRVAIFDDVNQVYYQFDGTFNSGSPLFSVEATQTNTTVDFTNWEQELTGLPAGDYTLYVLTEDNAQNNRFAPRTWTERDLIVVGNPLDVIKPVTIIDATATDGEAISMPFTLAGVATDVGGSGINRTRVAIQEFPDGNWYGFDGSFGAFFSVEATQSNTTVDFTNWEQQLTSLPVGDYTLFVLTEDNAQNNRFAPRTWTERLLTVAISGSICNGLPVTVDIASGGSPTSGDDVILGTGGADTINGLGGNDTICGGNGADVINGGGGDDTIYGGAGADLIDGGGGNDELYGEAGNDEIFGRSGDDMIDGGTGVDSLSGGPGPDEIHTGSGATVGSGVFVSGGGGADTIYGGAAADDLRGGSGADIIFGSDGNDRLIGGIGRDTLYGGAGADDIRGQDSRDDIFGEAGSDVITGGPGNDTIDGGSGNDSCAGQAGIDTATDCETETSVP